MISLECVAEKKIFAPPHRRWRTSIDVGAGILDLFEQAIAPEQRNEGITREGLKVCGLAAGAEWIRTFSSALDRQQLVVSSEFGRSTGAR
jgi:hypothetical protein